MKISPLDEYGLRVALRLAEAHSQKKPLPATELALMEGLSAEYASKVLYLLRKAKIVSSTRGLRGGYLLAKSPADLSVGEIFAALNPGQMLWAGQDEFCRQHRGQLEACAHTGACRVKPFWSLILGSFHSLLDAITLEHLMGSHEEVDQSIKTLGAEKLKEFMTQA